MAIGRRRNERQVLWIATWDLPSSPGHPFCGQFNNLPDEAGFDGFREEPCRRSYAETMDRSLIWPGVYFRILMIWYFKRLDGERQIAWRCGVLKGRTIGAGASMMEANPTMRSIVRKDTGQRCQESRTKLAKASVARAPTVLTAVFRRPEAAKDRLLQRTAGSIEAVALKGTNK